LIGYWSLAVEEQFYLVYPALFIAVCAIARRWPIRSKLAAFLVVVVSLSFAWSVFDSPRHILSAYYSPFTHAWELAVGGLLAVSTKHLRRIPSGWAAVMTWVGLGALVVLGWVISLTPSGYPGWVAIWPVLAAALVVGAGTAAPRYGAEMLLRTAPFKWMGRWSYSIYLWNFPLLVFASQHWGQLSGLENVLICVGVVALSAATYFFIENPIRHSSRLVRSPAASVAMGALLVATTFALTFAIT
jgi:peptidoglycan/LPS O-acetylase OafA/YrhL